MAYVDFKYYTDTFHGEPVSETGFPALENRAAELIEELTMYRLNEYTFEGMSLAVQDAVKRAVCAEIEYIDANGGSDIDNGEALQSATLGKFSYSSSAMAAGDGSTDGISKYSPRARRILAPTWLLYRGGHI